MKNNSLFSITQERLSIEAIIEEMCGELTPDMEQALKINQEEVSKKGESYIVIMEKMHASIEFNKRYKEQAETNIKRAEKALDRLKGNLLVAVETFGEFEAGIHKVGVRKSESLQVIDEKLLDPKYKKVKMVESWDIAGMKQKVKAGEEIKGVELVSKNNLKIS